MSIICAVKKKGQIAICADTQTSFGSHLVSAEHIVNSKKLYTVNGSVLGIVGWAILGEMVEHLITTDKKLFQLNGRREIFETTQKLHEKLKTTYKIETKEEDDQPVESMQLNALVANKYGLFEIASYRSVTEFKTYYAIGSGAKYAIGAMHVLYNKNYTANQIAQAGVKAACEFDDGCGLPLHSKTIRLAR